MANSISYAEAYRDLLDKIFKMGSLTADLQAVDGTYKFDVDNVKTVKLQKVSVNGMGTYSRTSGYVGGDATVSWESHAVTQDRGRKFTLDVMDSREAKFTIARLMAEVMRTQIIPEIDAYRFSKMGSLCGVDQTANLTYDDAVSSLDTGIKTLDDAEVPAEGRVLYVSNEFHNLLKQSGEFYNTRVTHDGANGTINRKIMKIDDMVVKKIPISRFYSAFDFYDGSTSGQEAGGFTPSSGATPFNFMIVPTSLVTGIVRHNSPKLIQPQNNADSDGWLFCPRIFHDLFIAENKLSGLYIHKKLS